MSDKVCHVEMINIKRRIAVSNLGLGTITNFYDSNGDETDDPSTAITAVVEWFIGGWTDIALADYDGDLN